MLRRSLIVAFSLLLAGCNFSGTFSGSAEKPDGSGGNPGPSGSVAVAISPTAMRLQPEGSFQFACTVTGAAETGCTWAVTETGGGSVNASGLYTAPSAQGQYHVVATSRADATKKATATVTVATATASTGPWVTGYYAGWFWENWYPPEQVDMTAMTHFVFGRVAPGSGSLGGTPGTLVFGAGTGDDPGRAPDGGTVEDYLVKRAHAANVKALLMLGGDGADGLGFLRSTTDELRPVFVERIVDYLVAHDYDGVDVDWENELEGNVGMGVSADEARRRLKALLGEIRAEAATRPRYQGTGNDFILTFPGYAVSINFLQPGGKVEQWQADVANMVDQYNLMSYGVGTTWNGAGWSSWFSGPIFGASGNTPYDLDSSINAYVATGVPRNKLGIGIGFFGIYYGPSITGPRQPTAGNDIYEIQDVALAYSELQRKGYLSNGTLHWDDEAKSTYRTYGNGGYIPAVDPNSNPAGFLSYESERSIAAKGEWVRSTGVGGTILWTINYGYNHETQSNPLLAAVKANFLQ